MKNKKVWVVVAVLLTICISLVFAVESKTDDQVTFCSEQKDTLKGMQGVAASVKMLDRDVEKLGLSWLQIKDDVELRLRQNGIKRLTSLDYFKGEDCPCLYVTVNILNEGSSIVAYEISVEVLQAVYLKRDLTKMCVIRTWKNSSVISASKSNMSNIRQRIKDQVDMFCTDYLAVNPKR
ncbi:MAG TPA: hypothetical protein PLP05_10795 [Sedimentisphaerales bacterium]|nr:hypothetical protein [Sedimentisphaerales bacterium]